MLVLTRMCDDVICIGDDVEVKILRILGDTVRIGVTALRSVVIDRKEIRELADYKKPEDNVK
mgnify:CR=1 FL=1